MRYRRHRKQPYGGIRNWFFSFFSQSRISRNAFFRRVHFQHVDFQDPAVKMPRVRNNTSRATIGSNDTQLTSMDLLLNKSSSVHMCTTLLNAEDIKVFKVRLQYARANYTKFLHGTKRYYKIIITQLRTARVTFVFC
jgi:hypothetical protein